MVQITARPNQRYQFNFIDEDNAAVFIRNAFSSTLCVIWYKDDKSGLEVWVPFGTDHHTPLDQTETHYTVPRIFVWKGKTLSLGGCICFEHNTLIQQQMSHDDDHRVCWFVKSPLTRSDCLY